MENIVLCGFMGSGKTTVGKLAGELLGASFVDVDDLIVERAGMGVPEIFAAFGEEGFREREHAAVLELAGLRGIVLATGGGALTYTRNVEALKKTGIIVFLNPGFAECYRRIKDSDRPLVRANTKEQLAEMYRKRELLYREACNVELEMAGGPDAWAAAVAALGVPGGCC